VDLVFRDVRNVIAVFIACAMLGFGAVFFGRRNLEIIADTATHSFGRSFTVGLLGQLLLLPTFAMLVVGLVFTLVGILLLPFAALAYVLAAILALVAGYLAVAHAVGETVARRRMAHGAFVRAPNAYGYLFTGLIGLLGLWAAAALTGWMGPVVFVFRLAAAIVTWLAATTGFGAVLLSRAGLRESFSGRQYGESTDEYLWATPPATPTAAHMKMDRP
jgi:MFS family permease